MDKGRTDKGRYERDDAQKMTEHERRRERQARLAEALRANLKRRKTQERGRKPDKNPGKDGEDGPGRG